MIRKSIKGVGLCAALSLASPLRAQETVQVRVAVAVAKIRIGRPLTIDAAAPSKESPHSSGAAPTRPLSANPPRPVPTAR